DVEQSLKKAFSTANQDSGPMAEQGATNPSNGSHTTSSPVPRATTTDPGWAGISRSSGPGSPEPTEKDVPQNPFNAPASVCCIERLQPELLEAIFLNLVGLGDYDYAQNKSLVEILVLVCRRWSAVASRLALVTIRIDSRQSADRAIERAHWLSNTQGGWAPTRLLDILHHVEGSFYRFAELVELFGRTLYKLKLHGGRKRWNRRCAEGKFPPAIEGQVYFPMLQTLAVRDVASTTVQACIRNIEPTKLKDMGLRLASEESPVEGYLSGQVFPRLEKLELRMPGEVPREDLKTATPGLKSLRIIPTNANISDFVAHMRRKWPGMLKHLEVTFWDSDENIASDHPAVRELAELVKEKKLISFELEVGDGDESWGLSIRQEPDSAQ
ncbi:hypothetical protein FRC01_013281, partial [Tulasnella sp. 417]